MAIGLGTRSLKLSVDGTDFSNAVSSVKVTAGDSDSDFLTFAAAAAGGSRAYTLDMTLVQDVASASLWRKIWDTSGDEVDVIIRPAGSGTSGTPSAAQPEFTFSAIISEPDGDFLGGDADTSTTARFTADVSWKIIDKPVLVAA